MPRLPHDDRPAPDVAGLARDPVGARGRRASARNVRRRSTTRSKRAPDFESVLSIGSRLVARATRSSTDGASGVAWRPPPKSRGRRLVVRYIPRASTPISRSRSNSPTRADRLTLARFRAADLVVETKPDLTPVTEADHAVEEMAARATRTRASRTTRWWGRSAASPERRRVGGSSTPSTAPRATRGASRCGPR